MLIEAHPSSSCYGGMWIAHLMSSAVRKHEQPKAQNAVPVWLSQKQGRNS